MKKTILEYFGLLNQMCSIFKFHPSHFWDCTFHEFYLEVRNTAGDVMFVQPSYQQDNSRSRPSIRLHLTHTNSCQS